MPTIPNRTRYASFGVAATIFEAADASKTYVRMPTSNATIEPRTTGTWYVGVCESSRHDWPNPAPDFVPVASMLHREAQGLDHGLWAAQVQHDLVAPQQDPDDGLPGRDESLNRVRQLQFSVPSWPDVRERGEDVLREDIDGHDRVIAPRSLRLLDGGRDPEDAWLQCVALDHAIGTRMGHVP